LKSPFAFGRRGFFVAGAGRAERQGAEQAAAERQNGRARLRGGFSWIFDHAAGLVQAETGRQARVGERGGSRDESDASAA
jgi:hypothetical protein